jgi:hypothetical protein
MRNLAWFTLVSMAVGSVMLGACGDDETNTTTSASGTTTGTGTSTSTTSSGGGNGGEGGSGGSGGAGGQGGGGAICGGIAGLTCADDEYCDFAEDECGGDDSTGLCTPRPQGCPDNVDPTCACNGQIYSNSCEAYAAGQDVSNLGGCPVEPDQFACGPKICVIADQYCTFTASDVPGAPDSYSCGVLPPECFAGPQTPTCDCLQTEAMACFGQCAQDPNTGALTLTCPGG